MASKKDSKPVDQAFEDYLEQQIEYTMARDQLENVMKQGPPTPDDFKGTPRGTLAWGKALKVYNRQALATRGKLGLLRLRFRKLYLAETGGDDDDSDDDNDNDDDNSQ